MGGFHVGAGLQSQLMGHFTGSLLIDQDPVLDDVHAASGDPFVIHGMKSHAVGVRRIADDIDRGRAVLVFPDHIGGNKGLPGIGDLHAEDPVGFGGMSHGFMDLKG